MTAEHEFDFSHLEVKQGVTAIFDIIEMDTPHGTTDKVGLPLRHPRLTLAPATRETRAYWSRALKRSGRRQRTRIDEAALEEGREEDLELFPKFIVKGWEGVFNTKGKPVPFSEAECRKFLSKIPNWIFTGLRGWAKDPVNFLDDDEPSAGEVADQGNG